MKVGVWLNEHIKKQVGGGFSYVDRMVNLIDEYEFSKGLDIIFISNQQLGNSFKKEFIYLKPLASNNQTSINQKVLNKITNKINFLDKIYKQSKEEIKTKQVNDHYRKQLSEEGVSVIYHLSQMEHVVNDFPFITTNWDIGHLSMFPFPEVASRRTFKKRELWYSNTINKAISVFAESNAGKEELLTFTTINPSRIKVLPMFPGGVINCNVSPVDQDRYLKSIVLASNNYFFYPAQFWAHKNHYNLLLAFKQLVAEHPDFKLVFSGSDKGNLDYIKNEITKHDLSNNVQYLGFIELDDMFTLYKNAMALVMPTFLGPTNMPLLEARALGCPVLCSDFKGHREQLEDAALYFDPIDHQTIFEAMNQVMNPKNRQSLLDKAEMHLAETAFRESNTIKVLDESLVEISKYRHCWE